MNMGAVLGVIEGRRSQGRVVWRLRRTGELIYATMHCPQPQIYGGLEWISAIRPRLALHQSRLITFLCAGVHRTSSEWSR